jgi:hypothetical protein
VSFDNRNEPECRDQLTPDVLAVVVQRRPEAAETFDVRQPPVEQLRHRGIVRADMPTGGDRSRIVPIVRHLSDDSRQLGATLARTGLRPATCRYSCVPPQGLEP